MRPRKRKPGEPARAGQLVECEWNFFDQKRVDDGELVACCFWEYARASTTLRGLRERCLKALQAEGARRAKNPCEVGHPCQADDNAEPPLLFIVAGTIRHQSAPVETFLREIVRLPPPDLAEI